MSVQLSSANIGRIAPTNAEHAATKGSIAADSTLASSTLASATVAATQGSVPDKKAAEPTREDAGTWRIAFAARLEQVNRKVTNAQRSLAFLDKTTMQLHELKSALSGSVAGRVSQQAELEGRLAMLQTQWQARHAATGGALGEDLSFHEQGGTRQTFRIHALDLPSLQREGTETLTVYPNGAGKRSVSLPIEGGQRAERDLLRLLDHALAPTGIRATIATDRSLVFSISESRWPTIRDQLMLQGGGNRYPGGWPSRAKTEALPAAIEPRHWQVTDASAQRATLRRVMQALDQINTARTSVAKALDQAGSKMRAVSDKQVSAAAQRVASEFATTLEQTGDFQRFATIGSALRGVTRDLVLSVLKETRAK